MTLRAPVYFTTVENGLEIFKIYPSLFWYLTPSPSSSQSQTR